jgi:hypothetical protein
MVLWGFWVLAALIDPAPSHSVLGLAVVAAALLIMAAFVVPALAPVTTRGFVAFARRARTSARPRLTDPDAAGRPRPRAPSARPAA